MALFQIKEGKHYSTPRLLGLHLRRNLFEYRVQFGDSCLYSFNNEDQLDINKLAGFSFGFNHHNNSYRVGWRSDGNVIDLHHYYYENGERKMDYICSVLTGFNRPTLTITIVVNKLFKSISVTVYDGKDITKTSTIAHSGIKRFGYYLNPHFGGNRKAPHKMFIRVKRNNIW